MAALGEEQCDVLPGDFISLYYSPTTRGAQRGDMTGPKLHSK